RKGPRRSDNAIACATKGRIQAEYEFRRSVAGGEGLIEHGGSDAATPGQAILHLFELLGADAHARTWCLFKCQNPISNFETRQPLAEASSPQPSPPKE